MITPEQAIARAHAIIDAETGPNYIDLTIIIKKIKELQDEILIQHGFVELIELRKGHEMGMIRKVRT